MVSCDKKGKRHDFIYGQMFFQEIEEAEDFAQDYQK